MMGTTALVDLLSHRTPEGHASLSALSGFMIEGLERDVKRARYWVVNRD